MILFSPLPPMSSPKITLRGARSSPMRATNLGNNMLSLRTIAPMPSESVLARAMAYEMIYVGLTPRSLIAEHVSHGAYDGLRDECLQLMSQARVRKSTAHLVYRTKTWSYQAIYTTLTTPATPLLHDGCARENKTNSNKRV